MRALLPHLPTLLPLPLLPPPPPPLRQNRLHRRLPGCHDEG